MKRKVEKEFQFFLALLPIFWPHAFPRGEDVTNNMVGGWGTKTMSDFSLVCLDSS